MAVNSWKFLEKEDLENKNDWEFLNRSSFNVPAPFIQDINQKANSNSFKNQNSNYVHNWDFANSRTLKQNYNQPQINPFLSHNNESKAFKKTTLLQDFKRIYFEEVLRFTMNKATFFTLIFSFMFLGCVFFLMGFITATGVYSHQQKQIVVEKISRTPSEQALLQGKPAKMVDMGKNIAGAPKQFQMNRGIRMSSNSRQPSPYVQQQINSHQPNYR